jgi:transcriptional regulator with XRE-family HTH domain
MHELLKAFFDSLWLRRPNDVSYRPSLTIQAAMSHLREQSKMTREEMSDRLGVNNSRLAYLESRGNLTEKQLHCLVDLAHEYAMPNLAGYFESRLAIFHHPNVRGERTRGRRKIEQ